MRSDTLILDRSEHFEKMSYRNKYYITGSNGMITLSVPLVKGREQRSPVGTIEISNTEKWQVQHWRTLVSVYKRSPYFDHYESSLQQLFEKEFRLLSDFDLASIEWLAAQLKLRLNIEFADSYQKSYAGTDLRNMKRSKETNGFHPKYYQVFEEKNGFLQNLSLLDLLFSEGPATSDLLNKWGD